MPSLRKTSPSIPSHGSLFLLLALAAGEPWTTDIVPKKNGPNLLYVNEADRLALEPEYKRLEAYLDLNP